MSSEGSRRSYFGDFIVVWIIEQEDAGNNLADTELDRIRNSIKIFNDSNECVTYIQNAKKENILWNSHILRRKIMSVSYKSRFLRLPSPSPPITDHSNRGQRSTSTFP
jgi:hypothetical protein